MLRVGSAAPGRRPAHGVRSPIPYTYLSSLWYPFYPNNPKEILPGVGPAYSLPRARMHGTQRMRWILEPPRRAKRHQDTSKRPQDASEILQDAPRRPQNAPKTPPRRDFGPFEGIKMGRSWHQNHILEQFSNKIVFVITGPFHVFDFSKNRNKIK